MRNLQTLGGDWLADEVDGWTDAISHITPVEFNEQNRYLPDSVTPMPGFMSFDINPYMREIVNACDPRSDVREVNLQKGVQITYTTMLETILLFYMVQVKTRPCMLISADKELVKGRIENYILPMLAQSDFSHIIKSSDEGNSRKTGKTATHLQWLGGGFLVPAGANNADKMRMWSIVLMLKDEIDAWQDYVGKDGDPDTLTDDRCAAFWESRKIFRGGTPLIKGTSKIAYQFKRGDQRYYRVRCRSCGFPQHLRWSTVNKETGVITGFQWDTDDGILVPESVRYLCVNCEHKHYEHDKTALFSEGEGAHWHPTARPAELGIRSYHLPAFYSPVGFQPWYKCVGSYLKGFNPVEGKVTDIGKYQIFYNNILAEPFEVRGVKVSFELVSAHRRAEYKKGQVPNLYAAEHSKSPILMIQCQVDVHKENLAVSVIGVCRDLRTYLIDYWRFEDKDCTEISSPVWGRLRELIEETEYTADDGKKYRIVMTLVDAGYSNDTVLTFCSEWKSGVYPILGRDRPGKNATIKEFAEWTTAAGTVGYKITVDHYKDRMAMFLRREWLPETGPQNIYHFNAPVDIGDKPLKELTVEVRKKKTDDKGFVSYFWDRPGNARNELWDLLGYCHAGVEIMAYNLCIQHFELDYVDWNRFWEYIEIEQLYFTAPADTM